jgi:hypothetical protein
LQNILEIRDFAKKDGDIDMAAFIRHFGPGSGDYTAERDKLLEGIMFDEIVEDAKKFDRAYEKKL